MLSITKVNVNYMKNKTESIYLSCTNEFKIRSVIIKSITLLGMSYFCGINSISSSKLNLDKLW